MSRTEIFFLESPDTREEVVREPFSFKSNCFFGKFRYPPFSLVYPVQENIGDIVQGSLCQVKQENVSERFAVIVSKNKEFLNKLGKGVLAVTKMYCDFY